MRISRLRIGTFINYVILLAIGITTLYPMWYVLVYSISDPMKIVGKGALLLPQGFSAAALQYVLTNPDILQAYLNTLFVVGVGTALSMAVTALFAYPLTNKIPGVRIISFLTYFTILFNGGMVPTYVVVRETGLMNTLWSLIIPVLINPFYVIIMIKFFRTIPDSLRESATIDGANDLTILTRVILPLSLPALASVSLFYAVRYWNAFFQAIIYIANPNRWPIQVVLRQLLITQQEDRMGAGLGDQTAASVASENVRMATVVVATVPILLTYPFLQKHFAKGVMIGAVKG